MEFLNLNVLDNLGSVAALSAVALAVITDKLVWHTRLKKAEARADRWEKIALDALSAGAHAGVSAAEVTADVITAFPQTVRDKRGA